ncbi:lipase [Nocardia sp. NPDC050712]|uniref:esterase/lipase family protein n=1 Tax=Nocardia sp. NPDC050712 TaxID=3155518 RepID=UPI0033EE443E
MRGLLRRSPKSVLFAAALAAVWTTASAPAQADYPVDYNFFSGIPAELTNPGGSLPGANDWSCRPTAVHPDPVVLLHGSGGGGQTNWGVYAPLLANEGYCVYSLTYGALPAPWPLDSIGAQRPIPESAAQVGAFIDRVRAATGADRVDIVGHSRGNAVGNYYINNLGGAGKVDTFVALAPRWLRGTEWLPESGGGYNPTVTYTNILTRYDEIIVPYTVGQAPGPNATTIVVQDGCESDLSEHLGIAGSPRAAAFALNALDPANPRPVPCELIPPFTG